MKSSTPHDKPGHVTSGDIFDDLGFTPAETLEAKIKADIWQAIVRSMEQRKLTQAEAATLLKAHQPDISNLQQGKFSKFSITRLLQFAGRLDLDARIEISPPKTPKPGLTMKASAVGRKPSRKLQPV
jgi:predicted XRE-type DNA-binding protein